LEPVRVSSFSTVLTELAREVGGEQVRVTGHVRPDTDPHDYEPTPGDLKVVATAELVLVSARNLEGYVGRLERGVVDKRVLLPVGDRLKTARAFDDPHWWHSVECVKEATGLVRDALVKLRPEAREGFEQRASGYVQRLVGLQRWARTEVAKIPKDRRVFVTAHDAFGWLARENGFELMALEGFSGGGQPSSKKIAQLIERMREKKVRAIFPESLENPKVLEQIAREAGARLGGVLYADGLGTGAASTYEGMYRYNVKTVVEALK
jgi:zinc/manganese transport system substrate-binding protein